MSVKITVCGAKHESEEYQGALKLKSILQKGVPPSATGEILLFANVTLFGQMTKDVDVLLLGILDHWEETVDIPSSQKKGGVGFFRGIVDVRNFCTVIEIKSHDISGIWVQGTEVYVKYPNKPEHSVTNQSNNQKYAAANFFNQQMNCSLFVTNLIWLTQATSNDINSLLKINGKAFKSNVLGASFKAKDLVQLLVFQQPVQKKAGKNILSSTNRGIDLDKFQKILTEFSSPKTCMGELTRRKIELITFKEFDVDDYLEEAGRILIYRGRAGTGKTIGIIQAAIRFVEERQARVIILTYNLALVLDIRRLFALANLPDMFNDACICINTFHSYFLQLVNVLLYDGKLQAEMFLQRYHSYLKELNDFLKDETAIGLAKETLMSEERTSWEYILVDEGQDFTKAEKEIILKLYKKGRVIVADGGNQYVRREHVCSWLSDDGHDKEWKNRVVKLKKCLRQKENIIKFLNEYSKKRGMDSGKILSSGELKGGRVIIANDDDITRLHCEEMKRLLETDNIGYDMLYLVPHALVEKKGKETAFSMKSSFEKAGFHLWDGTNRRNRYRYSVNPEDFRVLQYDSSRGLEGWTVVCMDFDIFLQEKETEYQEGQANPLILESPKERKRKYLYHWSMIPLTRAIDTLIITLKNPDSEVGVILKEIARDCTDYVCWL